jgi:hypothetical protein
MGRKPVAEKKKLKHLVTTRVIEEKYRELKHITESPPHYPMSDLIRRILENRSYNRTYSGRIAYYSRKNKADRNSDQPTYQGV